jgi:pimeloyl-ACP methyl ester carboxylesterase
MSKPQAPAVVLVHGIGGSARIWAAQVASFAAAGLAPVAVDLPGYGGRPAVEVMDFEGLAADVEAAIAERGLEKPVLLGHSMGGMVAQTLLRRRPDAYRAAVLACTSPAFGNADGEFQRKFVADRVGALNAGKTMADLAPGLVARMVGPAAEPADAPAAPAKEPGEAAKPKQPEPAMAGPARSREPEPETKLGAKLMAWLRRP